MIFHDLFGWHAADLMASHWDGGRFVSHCKICGREMIKLPKLGWRLSDRQP
jgi:hypothetical protein